MDCAIFDLDGTLLDTSPGIVESVCFAAEKLGWPELPTDRLLSFIGPPLKDSFLRCYGCGEAEAERLTAAYREHYREGALLNARPYDDIFTLCEKLREAGCRLAVATSKPQVFAEQILRHFGFVFDVVHGTDLAGKLKKPELIRLCMEETGADAGFMIGDTQYDARAAQEAGVPFIGVSYGFGDPDEMMKYPCIGTADAPLQVLKIIREYEEPQHE